MLFTLDAILRRTIPGMETYQIQEGAALYYLTFIVIEWLRVFVAEEPCKIITNSLNYCHQHKSLRINACVILPTHLHLVVFDPDFDNERLRVTLRDMRQFTGRQLADYCDKHLPAVFAQVMKGTPRTDRARQFWQTKVRYIHENPLRKGLVWGVTAWRFSSAWY